VRPFYEPEHARRSDRLRIQREWFELPLTLAPGSEQLQVRALGNQKYATRLVVKHSRHYRADESRIVESSASSCPTGHSSSDE
jgi:hypothetical protein